MRENELYRQKVDDGFSVAEASISRESVLAEDMLSWNGDSMPQGIGQSFRSFQTHNQTECVSQLASPDTFSWSFLKEAEQFLNIETSDIVNTDVLIWYSNI